MPVTKTAKRALRVSKRNTQLNEITMTSLEVAIRMAEKSKKPDDIKKAISLSDKAAKKNVIHKNKASRIKAQLAKLAPLAKTSPKKKAKSKKK